MRNLWFKHEISHRENPKPIENHPFTNFPAKVLENGYGGESIWDFYGTAMERGLLGVDRIHSCDYNAIQMQIGRNCGKRAEEQFYGLYKQKHREYCKKDCRFV